MARKRIHKVLSGWEGINISDPLELVGENELSYGANVRCESGRINQRTGSRLVHTGTVGASTRVRGVRQWDAPVGSEIVAVAGGNLYHKRLPPIDAAFTSVAGAFSTTRNTSILPYRVGATTVLYLADGRVGGFHSWDGTTLLQNIAGTPANAQRLYHYLGRVFVLDGTKTLHASALAAPTDFTGGAGALSEDVETFDSQPLVAAGKVGGSLLLFKENNISRLTGTDPDTVSIQTDTQGVTDLYGCAAPDAVTSIGAYLFFISDAGPMLANEAGVIPVPNWRKVRQAFDSLTKTKIPEMTAEFHRGRREVWVSGPFHGATSNRYTYIWSIDTQKWQGPFIFTQGGEPAANSCPALLTRYERPDATETLMFGDYQGFVVDADDPTNPYDYGQYDCLRCGTVFTPAPVAHIPLVLGYVGVEKLFAGLIQRLNGYMPMGSSFYIAQIVSEAGSSQSVHLLGANSSLAEYPFKLNARGKSPYLLVTIDPTNATDSWSVSSLVVEANLNAGRSLGQVYGS